MGRLRARRNHVVRQRDEVERVPAVVAYLNQRLARVGFDDRPDRADGPAAGVDAELDVIENSWG